LGGRFSTPDSHTHTHTHTYTHTHTQWNPSNANTLGPLKCVLVREMSSFQGVNNTYLYKVGTWSSVLMREVSSFQGCSLRGIIISIIYVCVSILYIWLSAVMQHRITPFFDASDFTLRVHSMFDWVPYMWKKFVCDMAQCTVLTLLLIGAYAYVY